MKFKHNQKSKCSVMKSNESVSYKRSFLIGMILGDAYTRRCAKYKLTVEWTISHCERYTDLVEWKRDKLVELFGISKPIIHIYRNGKKEERFKRSLFSFTAGRRLRIVSQWFTKNNKKYITPKIKFMDHPVGLAMLLCDDGSVRKRKKIHKDGSIYYLRPSFTIATHSFSLEEVKRLLAHILFVFGVDGIINPERRWREGKRKEYYRINFNVENSLKLWKLVLPYMPQTPSINVKFAYAYERFGR
ncbi:MAG: hypothetical protein KKB46_03395 [Candidatus Omnitrophica bacterium]|nr:hypothetical protein [Candidatus Omnitrophota bacterium]